MSIKYRIIPPLPHTSLWGSTYIAKHEDNFIFFLPVPLIRMGGNEVKLRYYFPGHWMEVSGQIHASAALSSERTRGTHWVGEGGFHNPSGRSGENKNLLSLPRMEAKP
jgi:hypothetical protein